MSAALSERSQAEPAHAVIVGDDASAQRRVEVYRGNIASNAAGALAAIYPIVRKLVGDGFFQALALAYLGSHPSVSGDLNDFGGHLDGFLQEFEPAQPLPYLPDVARLEWKVHRAHYAADHAPLDLNAIGAVPGDNLTKLTLRLHPAVAVVDSAYPLFRIWEVHQNDFDGNIEVDLASGAEHVIVYRPQFRATVARISLAQAQFLQAVQHGALLGAALDGALATDAAFDLAQSLEAWVKAIIVVAIEHTDDQ